MSKIYYWCKQILFYLFLIGYVLLLAKALLFKEVSLIEIFNADRILIRDINVIPFQSIFEYFASEHFNIWIGLMNVIGNIVLFIPLGLYLQIFKKNKKILDCVALACAVSLCVEIVQYIFGIGHTDIDDLILNTLGGLLGILLYRILYLILKDENKTKTAVTFLFLLVCAGAGGCYFVLVNVFGYRIKIF